MIREAPLAHLFGFNLFHWTRSWLNRDEFEGERTIGRCYLNAKCDPGIVVPVFQLHQVAPAQVLPEETDIAEIFFEVDGAECFGQFALDEFLRKMNDVSLRDVLYR